MRNHLFVFLLLCSLTIGCDDDSTAPQEPASVTFSRMMGGSGRFVFAYDVVGTSDGLRVVVGEFDGEDGDLAWLRRAGGGGSVIASRTARDASDNFYIVGYYDGNVTFGTANLAGVGDRDVFVAKMDANGNPLWASGSGTTADRCYAPIRTSEHTTRRLHEAYRGDVRQERDDANG